MDCFHNVEFNINLRRYNLAPLASSRIKRTALGESIVVPKLEVQFEPLTKLWDDEQYWAGRGLRSPKSQVGRCSLTLG
jgi:hypothetical protein